MCHPEKIFLGKNKRSEFLPKKILFRIFFRYKNLLSFFATQCIDKKIMFFFHKNAKGNSRKRS
jgi:hypothetical protein